MKNKGTGEREFWESGKGNNQAFNYYFDRLVELSVSRFKWINLPKNVDERFMELALLSFGAAIFYKEEALDDYVCMRYMPKGGLSPYGIANERSAWGVGYTYDGLNNENSVIIYNNYLREPSEPYILMFAEKLYDVDRSIIVNAKAQKTPIVIQCSEPQRLAMKNLYMKYEGNQPFIFGDKNFDTRALQVLHTDAPYVADRLYALKNQIWNEALTYLGISNLTINKKERLITDEVEKNNGAVIASRNSQLKMRQKACEEINRKFGLNIWCEFQDEYEQIGGSVDE